VLYVTTTTLSPDLVGASIGEPTVVEWTSEQALIYALGIGAGQADPAEELPFTTNNRGAVQQVYPTFGAVLASMLSVSGMLTLLEGAVDLASMLHAHQQHEQFHALPAEGTGIVTSRISALWDKGNATIVETVTEFATADGETLLARSTQSMFFRGIGGWGGERGPSAKREELDREADDVLRIPTRRDQPLLYRLTGDNNPLHTDPETARAAGFPGPIMHGMCVWGMVGRVLLNRFAGSDPARYGSLSARFALPVTPGDELTVRAWNTSPESVIFHVENSSGEIVLSAGEFTYTQLND
jgi:acyl dehydratase